MSSPPVLITARLASSRLPRKMLLPLGNMTVIDHVISRCRHFGFTPYICCNVADDVDTFKVATSCEEVFGMTGTVETALIECSLNYDIPVFHQLDGDDPFFSREMVVESLQCLRGGRFSRIRPSVASQSGSGLVGTSYNLKAPENSTEETLPDPAGHPWPQRLTLDYEEDYHLICAVNRMVGGYMAPRWAVDELFLRNPDLHKVNWFRNEEWKARQCMETRSENITATN